MPEQDGIQCSAEGAAGVQTVPSPSRRSKSPAAGDAGSHSVGLIVCAGMPRGGSTLQYNLVRLLAERHLEAKVGGWVETFETFAERFPECGQGGFAPRRPLVVKTHAFDPRWAALIDRAPGPWAGGRGGHVFHIYRDLRDALLSFTRRFGGTLEENIERWAARWVDWAERWSSLLNVTIARYEAVMREPRSEALRYAEALGIQVSEAEIDRVVEACSSPRMRGRAGSLKPEQEGEYDPEYLVHADHLADGRWGQWQRDMTPAQREAVWKAAGLWLEEHGYPHHEQFFTEEVPAEMAETPPIDSAPPGVPKLRSTSDPLVESFGAALAAPIWPSASQVQAEEPEAETFYGDMLRVLRGEAVSTELVVRGYFEEGLTWALLQCLRPGDTFLDVGAHVGYFTLLAARLVGEAGRVEALEPTPQTARRLRSNARHLRQVSVHQVAAFSRAGPLGFHDLGTKYAAYNSIYAPRIESAEDLAPPRQCTVRAVTLNDFCKERELIPDFIKIDAESAELDVLQGAAGVLAQARPIVSVEVGDCGVPGAPTSRSILEFAEQLGYRAYEYKAFGQFVPHRPKPCYSYDNLLLLPPARWRARHTGDSPHGLGEAIVRRALDRLSETIKRLRDEQADLRAEHARLEARYKALWEETLPGTYRRDQKRAAVLHRAFVVAAWKELARRYQTVALFGAGKFARWLVCDIAPAASGPKVVRLLDDAAQPGSTLNSIPVVRPGRGALRGADAVVVATDLPDSPLHRRCAELCSSSVPMVNLYAGMDEGPFPKAEWIKAWDTRPAPGA